MRPPRVLVAYATRHASTAEIAAVIAAELDAAGCRATLGEVRSVEGIAGYDAAVIGSALYLGRWDEAAVDLVRRELPALAAIPTWLFSSGPVGVGPATARPERLPQPPDVGALAEEIGAHATTFGGRVDPADDGLESRIMASAGLTGDWRDFARIRAWARAIAADLLVRTADEAGDFAAELAVDAGDPSGDVGRASGWAGDPAIDAGNAAADAPA
jgi:menaquinone-dependent protoporphyrinogen oxidase